MKVVVIMYGLNDGLCRSLILEVEKIGEFILRCYSLLMINVVLYLVIKLFKWFIKKIIFEYLSFFGKKKIGIVKLNMRNLNCVCV